jgi:hypothetical protein
MALDLPEIMASKQATNRPKDRLQLPEIEATLLLRERNAASDTATRRDHAVPGAVQADSDRGEPGSGSGG